MVNIKLETPKYAIGDIVSSEKYKIDEAMVIGIRLFSKEWGDKVDGIDYDFVYQDDEGQWNKDGLSEDNLD